MAEATSIVDFFAKNSDRLSEVNLSLDTDRAGPACIVRNSDLQEIAFLENGRLCLEFGDFHEVQVITELTQDFVFIQSGATITI